VTFLCGTCGYTLTVRRQCDCSNDRVSRNLVNSRNLVVEQTPMANYKEFDPRVDALVVETITCWDSEIGDISEEDKAWLASAIHQDPQLASNVRYERAHTGFTREITITVADIERLYQDKVSS